MKISVALCKGCGIGESIDLDKLKTIAEKEFSSRVCISESLCNDPDVLKECLGDSAEKIVIGACSSREKQENFTVSEEIVTERVNLREGVVWSHNPGDSSQEIAEDYIRMGLSSAMKKSKTSPVTEGTSKDILVIGGGISGITASLESARAGYNVYLVEKTKTLGGKLLGYEKLLPKEFPYTEMIDSRGFFEEKIREIGQEKRIKVFLSSEVSRISGQPGMFEVTVKGENSEVTITVGSVILATGWKQYDAHKIKKFRYGENPNILTNMELEEMIKSGNDLHTGARQFAFILCAGQRDEENIPYCSAVCCATSLKEAMLIREKIPEATVYIFYKDMRTLGVYEEFYKNAQQDSGIFFLKAEIEGLSWKESEDKIRISLKDSILGSDFDLDVDKVILATGMVSSMYGMYNTKEEHPQTGPLVYSHLDPVPLSDGASPDNGERFLHLQYRQGPELPTLRDGFPDSHYVCFPYESRRTGTFATGSVRNPSTVANCELDAKGAALKAIRTVELASKGLIIESPKVGERDHITISLQRCTQCRRCTEECPFGAIDEDEKTNPLYNPLRCRDCGICMGACPVQAVSFKQYSVDEIHDMIKSIKIPEDENELRVLVFACENDAYPALDTSSQAGIKYGKEARIIPVRCLGSINNILIADSLSVGIDGILLLGCKYGQDYQCHFVRGSELASIRLGALRETLDNLALEPERLALEQIEYSDWDKVGKSVDNFIETVRKFGPNPYRGL